MRIKPEKPTKKFSEETAWEKTTDRYLKTEIGSDQALQTLDAMLSISRISGGFNLTDGEQGLLVTRSDRQRQMTLFG